MTSIIKVDNLQNQCGANIINENAGTITIGASGDTVTLAAGASQSGFGRSGSVNWDTTPKTTSPVTAVSGNGYFIDTTSGAITINLPSTPSAGDIVAIADYDGTAITNNITIGRNSSNINGDATDLTINANYSAVTLVYVDATSGWRSVDSSNPNDIVTLPEYVAATGGTVTCCGDYKIHTFTGPGTFTVTNAGSSSGSNTVEYMVVAGGGGGGMSNGGGAGGGAGGFRQNYPSPTAAGLPVTAQSYPITVGGGGPGGPGTSPGPAGSNGTSGNPSIFSTITSTAGGGGGGSNCAPANAGLPGGSGGGGGRSSTPSASPAGTGNTPPTSPSQGNNGGTGGPVGQNTGGGGGGAGAAGTAATPGSGGGPGGTGSPIATTFFGPTAPSYGTPGPAPGRYFAGGGGGNEEVGPNPSGAGGAGGGGAGGGFPSSGQNVGGNPGTINTGGGGGGGDAPTPAGGGNGGSGIVIIRYKYQ
jgi:hypothetical protein